VLKKNSASYHVQKKTLYHLWTDADILRGMYDKTKHKIKDRQGWLIPRELALSFWNIKEKDKS
jgi:hypothetical protein